MMNWLQFFLWITGIYTVYYLVMIAFDLKINRRLAGDNTTGNELTFDEPVEAIRVEPEPDEVPAPKFEAERTGGTPGEINRPKAAIISSGGVSLKDLFSLAREEAIIYTRPVSF